MPAVQLSGRGNNFVYVNKEADLEQAMAIIINGKTSNISVCNALDKVRLIPISHIGKSLQAIGH
jgi:gamma-glutamyl phosphate reductase